MKIRYLSLVTALVASGCTTSQLTKSQADLDALNQRAQLACAGIIAIEGSQLGQIVAAVPDVRITEGYVGDVCKTLPTADKLTDEFVQWLETTRINISGAVKKAAS